ncbi:MAG: Holliday junction branch migration protein RuvA [Bacteroidaceae bacterium]|nr:Holliday junction branch migration protein RuvA [Bacteroidaceae bacterium]
MIAYIEGRIDELTPATAVLEAGGVGYELGISLQTYEALSGKERARLYVYEQVRQDAATQLFGFASKPERTLFLQLLSVSGIGGQTARTVVSAYSPEELARVIANEDKRALTAIKGIGKKAAERIVVELRDKVGLPQGAGYTDAGVPGMAAVQTLYQEAVGALSLLGYDSATAGRAVSAITEENPSATLEDIIKLTLKRFTK